MRVKLEPSWEEALKDELSLSYLNELALFLEGERAAGKTIYPAKALIFNALDQVAFDQVKVVIVGQDPYHGPGQAHGLCFSVSRGTPPPPSLKNIFKELEEDADISTPKHGCLINWARQGVLLLNATLTVQAHSPRSHFGKGWERFTDAIIQKLSQRKDPLVFLLWGRDAKMKYQHIDSKDQNNNHLVLTAAHPSPFSAHNGFFGCRHFSKTNNFLKSIGKTPIDWEFS